METTPEDRARALTAGAPPLKRGLAQLPDREYVSVLEAMRLLNVARRTIHNWMDTGKIQRYLAPNGWHVRIDKEDLLLYNEHRIKRGIVINQEDHPQDGKA